MKKYSWKPEGGAPIIEDIPADQMEKATELHKALIEAAAENDEGLMEKFFDKATSPKTRCAKVSAKVLPLVACSPYSAYAQAKIWVCAALMEFLGNVVPFVTDMPKDSEYRR
jgi:elongation factor G